MATPSRTTLRWAGATTSPSRTSTRSALPGPSSSSTDLFAARFEVEGSHPIGWPESGLMISGAPGVQRQGRVVGSFFAWTDERSGDGDIYALLVRSDGTSGAEWPADGLLVCGVA